VPLQVDLALENVDFACQIGRHPIRKAFFPAGHL
jgi:hypothetical protein